MLKLIRRMWRKFWHNEEFARKVLRGLALWAGGAAVQVAGAGWDVVQAWSAREWFGRLAVAGILGLGGWISVGQRNPPKEPDK